MAFEMQNRPSMMLQTPEERQMGMFVHLAQLANLVLFPVGVIIPIVLWQSKKEQMPALDAHGKMVVNWMISAVIYGIVSFVLVFLIIGIFLLIALGLLSVIFPIVGAIKANNGELWEYPLTIKFLK